MRINKHIGALLSWAALLAICGWLGAGCRSVKEPGGATTASVTISGRSPLETAHAVSEVFRQAGYKPVPLPANRDFRLAFEKPGGFGDTLLYGDWAPNRVWYRVRIQISAVDPDTLLLTCDAFRVLDHGDSHFEEEQKLSKVKKGPYRDLLAQVKGRLAAPAR